LKLGPAFIRTHRKAGMNINLCMSAIHNKIITLEALVVFPSNMAFFISSGNKAL